MPTMMDSYMARNHMETYYGQVKSPTDAIILFEACRLGTLPRVQRRLSEKERQQIRSGSVFVWDEREAGMRRWTDGKSWSASRVNGSFLTYREMEGKRGGGSQYGSPTMGNGAAAVEDADTASSPDGYRYKPDGLVKQSFSIQTSAGQHLHLISYFSRSHPHAQTMPSSTSDPALRHIRPAKGMYPDSTLNDATNMPAVTRSPMGESPFGGNAPYNPNAYLRHAPPPNFGWPPTPSGTPGAMSNPWAGGYFPYPGFPMPNGMPFPWANPAWFAQGMQFFQQQQAAAAMNGAGAGQSSQSQQTPGMTAFDRVPPPLRGAQGGPPPPPAPSQPYPHLQPQSQQNGGSHTPLLNPVNVKSDSQVPQFQNAAAWQAQYQAWVASQQQAMANGSGGPQTPYQQQQPSTPVHAQGQGNVQSQEQAKSPTTAQQSTGQPPLPSQSQQSATQTQSQDTLSPPARPNLYQSNSAASTHDQAHPAPEVSSPQKTQSIPSITALMESNKAAHAHNGNTNGVNNTTNGHSSGRYPIKPAPAPLQQYSHLMPKGLPPQYAPVTGAQARPSENKDASGSGKTQAQQGYGADMNALRRLDRAFAP